MNIKDSEGETLAICQQFANVSAIQYYKGYYQRSYIPGKGLAPPSDFPNSVSTSH